MGRRTRSQLKNGKHPWTSTNSLSRCRNTPTSTGLSTTGSVSAYSGFSPIGSAFLYSRLSPTRSTLASSKCSAVRKCSLFPKSTSRVPADLTPLNIGSQTHPTDQARTSRKPPRMVLWDEYELLRQQHVEGMQALRDMAGLFQSMMPGGTLPDTLRTFM